MIQSSKYEDDRQNLVLMSQILSLFLEMPLEEACKLSKDEAEKIFSNFYGDKYERISEINKNNMRKCFLKMDTEF